MIKIILFVSVFGLLSCASVKTNSNTDQISSLDVNRINEIYRIQSIVAKEVWPGFEKAEFRFVVVGQKYQWAINIDPLPAYYRTISVPEGFNKAITSLAVTEIYRNEYGEKKSEAPEVLYNGYSKENTNLHYKHSVYFVKSLDEFHRIGDRQDAEEWVHISLHELFHTFQDQYVNYTPEFLDSVIIPLKKIITTDEQHTKLLKPEVELLAKAVCAGAIKDTKKFLKLALQLRKKRWAYIHAKYKVSHEHWERFESWAEGTAHYTEHQIMSKYPQFKEGTLLNKDPYFSKFNEYTVESQNKWCERIASNQKRKYWYVLGFSYALILDKLMPEWKSSGFDNNLFFDAYFKKMRLID